MILLRGIGAAALLGVDAEGKKESESCGVWIQGDLSSLSRRSKTEREQTIYDE